MGLCFSKKRQPSSDPIPPVGMHAVQNKEEEEEEEEEKAVPVHAPPSQSRQASAEVAAEKKRVFVVTAPSMKRSPVASEDKETKEKGEMLTKRKACTEGETCNGGTAAAVPMVGEFKSAPVRTSSCTKEEVDAILIQCGRLSRSSSGKAGAESGFSHRRYSGSKRSYDFDNEKKGEEAEEDWGERLVSRPSPQRRTSSRERSGSRERGNGSSGGRRVSRSPGRRSEVQASSGTTSERSRQPAKMVSVPAREKTRGVSPAGANKRGNEAAAVRSASPRSRSPANTTRVSNENAVNHSAHNNQPQSLSRSSSRKAEQSPYRRNPMSEIDENTMRSNQNGCSNNSKVQKVNKEGDDLVRKATQLQTQRASETVAQMQKSEQRAGGEADISTAIKSNDAVTLCVREQLLSCRTKDQQLEPETVEEAIDKGSLTGTSETPNVGIEIYHSKAISRTRSSRKSSRDLDNFLGLNPDNLFNPASYTSLLLEDIQNYHQQHQNTAFSLPACVSKACSIVEAVADLNSSSFENKGSEAERYRNDNSLLNGGYGRRGFAPKEPFVESEIVVKDDLLEPSLHKYVTVRDLGIEMEPQESAGSNSFIGQPWASPWESNSVDSSDRYWTSKSINGEELEQEAELSPLDHPRRQHLTPEALHDSEARGRRSRCISSINSHLAPAASTGKRSVSSGSARVGGRVHSIPAAAATASS